MEYEEMSESNILGSVVQDNDVEGSFANVDIGSGILGKVPDVIRLFPRELPVHNRSRKAIRGGRSGGLPCI